IGNLYVANKRDAAEFDRVDEAAVEIVATIGTVLATIASDRTRLLEIIEAAPDGVLFVDAVSGFVLANRTFRELLGGDVEPRKGVAVELGVLLPPDGRAVTLEDLPSSRALAGQVTIDRPLLIARRDGGRIPVAARAIPIRSAAGKVIGAVSRFTNVSRQEE